MDDDLAAARRDHNTYQLDLWPDPAKDRFDPFNKRRLLGLTFDLFVGRAAFLGARARFPGREVTLRDRARIIRSTERAEDVELAIEEVLQDLGLALRDRGEPRF